MGRGNARQEIIPWATRHWAAAAFPPGEKSAHGSWISLRQDPISQAGTLLRMGRGGENRQALCFWCLRCGTGREAACTGQEFPGDWEKAAPAPRSIHLPSRHNQKRHFKAKLLLAWAEAAREEFQPPPAAQNHHRPVQAFIFQAEGSGSISDISGLRQLRAVQGLRHQVGAAEQGLAAAWLWKIRIWLLLLGKTRNV